MIDLAAGPERAIASTKMRNQDVLDDLARVGVVGINPEGLDCTPSESGLRIARIAVVLLLVASLPTTVMQFIGIKSVVFVGMVLFAIGLVLSTVNIHRTHWWRESWKLPRADRRVPVVVATRPRSTKERRGPSRLVANTNQL